MKPISDLLARRIGIMFLVGALVLAAWPVLTMAWSTWVIDDDTKAVSVGDWTGEGLGELAGAVKVESLQRIKARELRAHLKVGQPFAQLKIKRIKLNEVVRHGTRTLGTNGFDPVLDYGPAHIAWTKLPAEGGNFAISGHRTTRTKPFWDLQKMRKGDRIVVATEYGTFTYKVTKIFEVKPTDLWVAASAGEEVITLSTCTPRFSAARRLIVRGELIDSTTEAVKFQ